MSGILNMQQVASSLNTLATPATGSASQASSSAHQPGGLVAGSSLGTEAPTYSTPFAGVMRDAIAKTQELDTQASNAVTGLLSGQGVDIHTAMIATEKSDLAFEMMLSLRNKAIGAYQQLMGMQF